MEKHDDVTDDNIDVEVLVTWTTGGAGSDCADAFGNPACVGGQRDKSGSDIERVNMRIFPEELVQ